MKIVFCLPGKNFSGTFLLCWSELLAWCMTNGITVNVQQHYSCNIYYVRNMCLGGNVLNGENQKPFNETIDYDYIMWIDSDVIFSVEHFKKLLLHKKNIISGLYLMEDAMQFATVEKWDEDYFSKNGSFEFLTKNHIENKKEIFPVAYTGFGFILIKKGVFESLTYPWFRPEFIKIGNATDFTMEDVAFCRTITKKGYEIFVDPTVIVGHEKNKILI